MLSRKRDDTLAPHRLVPTRGLIRLVLLWGGVFHAGHPPGNAVTAATSNDSGTSLEEASTDNTSGMGVGGERTRYPLILGSGQGPLEGDQKS